MRGRHQPTVARTGPANGHSDARVGVEAVKLGGHVELDQVPLTQAAKARDAMDGLVVDADAGHPGEAVVDLRSRASTSPPEDAPRDRIKLPSCHAWLDRTPHHPQRLGHNAARRPQRGKLLGGLDRHGVSVREARTRYLVVSGEVASRDARRVRRIALAARRFTRPPRGSRGLAARRPDWLAHLWLGCLRRRSVLF